MAPAPLAGRLVVLEGGVMYWKVRALLSGLSWGGSGDGGCGEGQAGGVRGVWAGGGCRGEALALRALRRRACDGWWGLLASGIAAWTGVTAAAVGEETAKTPRTSVGRWRTW